MLSSSAKPSPEYRWLVFLYQLPSQPAYLRTKIWRRLQSLGAVPVRASAYVLPIGDDAREDLHWLVGEVVKGGGEAAVYEARLIDGLRDEEVEAQFNAARDEAYGTLIDEAQALLAGDIVSSVAVRRLRRRFEQQVAIDVFAARQRAPAERLIARIEERLACPIVAETDESEDLRGRIWVTRAHVFVDRVACAWVVKRFIDPSARFRFVTDRDYAAGPGELRFDMFEAEIGHDGDRCSMEVLIDRAGLGEDRALTAIAEIVHDIDLKDGKFGREQAAGIAHLLSSICATDRNDEQRIARSVALFNDLYDGFARNDR
jgi:hypothetical protein